MTRTRPIPDDRKWDFKFYRILVCILDCLMGRCLVRA